MTLKGKIQKKIKDNGIYYAVNFIIVLILLNSYLVYYKKNVVAAHNQLSKDIVEIKQRLENIMLHVNLADLGFRGYMIIQNDKLLDPYTRTRNIYNKNFNQLNKLLGKQGYDLAKVEKIRKAVSEYMDLVGSMVKMKDSNENEKIRAIVEKDPGYDVWKTYMGLYKGVTGFESALQAKSLAQYNAVLRNSLIMQLMMLFLGIPVLIGLIIRLKKNKKFRASLFKELDDSNRKYIFNPDVTAKEQNEKAIINHMIDNLKQSSEFIKKISNGDFAVKWEGLNEENKGLNQHNIAGELVNMRAEMEKVKTADERRLWETEGLSQFSNTIRIHQDNISELANTIISDLVKYMKANQGGLFVLNADNESDKHLVLLSCYAYDSKKYNDKRIEIGQGLVGQTFKEKRTLHLTEIPGNYMQITSGLGDATPRNLLIIPLKVNEQVAGVLELASFHKFEKHEIKFLEKLSEIIASGIMMLNTNDRTKILLENSQAQEEEMRAQEEEMRQNMEELQATQEEMDRQKSELELEISDLKAQLSNT